MTEHRQSFFGAEPEGRVYFNIRLDRSGQVPEFPLELNIADHVIPYATTPIAQEELVSVEPSLVTWRLWLADAEMYRALLAKAGTTDALYIVHGALATIDRTVQEGTVLYDVLAYTTLRGLGNMQTSRANGIEVDATFRRLIDPATGLGVAP